MKAFTFHVDGRPRGKGRPRATKTGHIYTPSETRAYEAQVRRAYRDQGGPRFGDQPVMVTISVSHPMPKGWNKTLRAQLSGTHCDRKPDLDNVVKIVLDALNGTAYDDDKQVAGIVARRIWSETGGVEVTIND